jgi:S1-C subfamily serine protease
MMNKRVAIMIHVISLFMSIAFAPPTNAAVPDYLIAKKEAVVSIYIKVKGEIKYFGSGFIISPSGMIATNLHVVKQAVNNTDEAIQVKKQDGTYFPSAKIVASDEDLDVALLQVDGKDLPYINLSQVAPKQGEDVVVIENPLGLDPESILVHLNKPVCGKG